MRKAWIYALVASAMSFFGALQGNEPNESDSELMCAPCQEERDIQLEKIYISPDDLSIYKSQIFAYLNGQWEAVQGLYTDAEGLYVVNAGYHPGCPPNFQKPVCPNVHPAVYEVVDPDGKHHRFVCNYHGCDYEYHKYIRNYLPPGYYLTGLKRGR